MTRDWRRVALAVLTAAALGGLSSLSLEAQPKQTAKAAKAPDKETPPAEKTDEKAADAEAKAPEKKKKQDPVEAQRIIENAGKLLRSGKADQAIQMLSGTVNAGNLPPPIMAKALYTRGLAYREKSQPAQAISDLTSALWLKGGLNEADRADALKQRTAAYSDAGLTDASEAVVAAKRSSGKDGTEEAAATGPGWFQNLFGASAAPAKAPDAPPKAPDPPAITSSIDKGDNAPAAAEKSAGRPRISKGWSSAPEVHAEQPPAKKVAAAPPAAAEPPPRAPPPTAAKAEGKYRVQLATVRTQEEARALASKAQREFGAILASAQPQIDQAVFGNMGSFYRLRFGPYATVQETQAVCAKLKGSAFDCMPVVQ